MLPTPLRRYRGLPCVGEFIKYGDYIVSKTLDLRFFFLSGCSYLFRDLADILPITFFVGDAVSPSTFSRLFYLNNFSDMLA